MTHTYYIYHETGHWGSGGPYNKYNASKEPPGPNRFSVIEVDEKDSWVCSMIKWNRRYHMQHGRKAAFITKVVTYKGGRPIEIPIKPIYAKLMCFVLNRPHKIIL